MFTSKSAVAALLACLHLASATPAPTLKPVVVAVVPPSPEITPSPVEYSPTQTVHYELRRDLLDSLKAPLASVFSKLGSDVPSYVASGVPNYFQNFPTGDAVKSSLGISDSDLAATPTSVLNVPPYANWTNQGWNIRFRGNVYKQPNTSNATLDRLANIFLIGTSIQDLPASEQDQARNLTASIFVVQQGNSTVNMHLEPAPSAGASGETGGGGAVPATGGTQDLTLPGPTTAQGDFDVFVPIAETFNLTAGNATTDVQRLNIYANGSDIGNATAYLVPPTGFTVVSDIDDILRITKIYEPKEGLLNSFARPFVPWMNMPDIYANWSRSIPGIHFHYLTTTPEQATRQYMDFIYKTYPGGSFDTRPLNFSDVSATLSIRKFLLNKIFETFPQRKFILVADTSNSDIMADYPQMATDYPGQVACILLRNTSSTDQDLFPYNTKGFKNLNQQSYMFFKVPDDLLNLDVVGGHCLNTTIQQNVTFGIQDELLGIHGAGSSVRASGVLASIAVAFVAMWISL